MEFVKKAGILALVTILFLFINCDANGTADQRYNSGLDYAIKRKFEKAKDEFGKALKIDGSHKQAQESLRVVNDVLNKKLNSDAGYYFFKAISRSNEGRLDEALIYFTMAIKQNTEFSYAYFERGLVYSYKGNYDNAIADFTRSIELNPKDAVAYNNRGLAFARGKKQYDHAFADFNKSIEINPQFAEAYDNRGIAYRVKFNDKEKACADWRHACELGKCNSYNLAKQNGYCQ